MMGWMGGAGYARVGSSMCRGHANRQGRRRPDYYDSAWRVLPTCMPRYYAVGHLQFPSIPLISTRLSLSLSRLVCVLRKFPPPPGCARNPHVCPSICICSSSSTTLAAHPPRKAIPPRHLRRHHHHHRLPHTVAQMAQSPPGPKHRPSGARDPPTRERAGHGYRRRTGHIQTPYMHVRYCCASECHALLLLVRAHRPVLRALLCPDQSCELGSVPFRSAAS